MKYKWKAFKIGLSDGLEQPYDLTMGMSYEDELLQWFWDTGANIGQMIGKLACGALGGA